MTAMVAADYGLSSHNRKGCLKKTGSGSTCDDIDGMMKKVFFDEIHIKEYPVILGDNPAVSSGAPVTIGWSPSNETVIDLDFYEYCRTPERKPRRKLILSVRRRANTLLTSGYSLEQIANATLEVEKTKKDRAESLRSAGWSNPWELLSGAVETTGTALKRADILGVGAATGAVIGASGQAVGIAVSSTVQGVNTVVGAGADMTVQTGRLLVGGVQASSRVVTDVATGVATGVVGASKAVAKPVVGVGKTLVVKPVIKTGRAVTNGVTTTGKVIGTGIATTGKAIGSVVTGTGRAMSAIVSPREASGIAKELSPNQQKSKLKRRASLQMKNSTRQEV